MKDETYKSMFFRMKEQELGRFGEALWANIFRHSGFNYIPLSKLDVGGAPMFEGLNKTVLPDFDVMHKSFTVYVESKAKMQSVFFRKRSQERHGIDRNRWNDYKRSEIIGRKDCAIAIAELWSGSSGAWSGTLLIETLRGLGEPYQGESSQRHMVYWQRKQFVDLDAMTPSEMYEVAKGVVEWPLASELENIFAPETQKLLL